MRLGEFWGCFGRFTRTKTRDTSEYGYHYLSALLRMETKRNIAQISEKASVPVQNMQHYISLSPWSGPNMLKMVRQQIGAHEYFESGGVLVLDESADERNGLHSAGVARQYNGRAGKVDLCQVGVVLSLAKNGIQPWIDGELFLPESWFAEEQADLRQELGVPSERKFQTKIELGWQMIQRAQAEGIAFDALCCDAFYGRSFAFRQQLNDAKLEYYADIPADTRVYLSTPEIGIPQNQGGRQAKKPRVLGQRSLRVDQVRELPSLLWQRLNLRPTERGFLIAEFARMRVWTVHDDLTTRQEWLLIRKDGKKYSYSLSNAPVTLALERMAQRKSQRYFVERSNQDSKSDFGWDEVQTVKFNAWEHQLAFTILAHWFIAQTRLDWLEQCPRDPTLLERYQTDVLPALSVANVRELLRSVLPLPQLSPQQAATLVVKHLDNRTRSRSSRILNASSP